MSFLRVEAPLIVALAVSISAGTATQGTAADGCTQIGSPIETDRPDVTNSSVVIPVGSLQSENGVNVSRRDGAQVLDGTNSRVASGWRPALRFWSTCRPT
jgi:hypothetical protein